MAYWLSNTSTLLFLLQRSLKAAGASATPQRKPPSATSLFGRMTMVSEFLFLKFLLSKGGLLSLNRLLCKSQGFRSSPSSSNLAAAAALAVVRQVEAKYPALLFKQQLAAYVEKIYGIIRDNLKKELASLLSLCIQVLCLIHHSHLRLLWSQFQSHFPSHFEAIFFKVNLFLC